MDIFNVFALLGGLALLLYGVKLMGQGLEKKAGGKLKTLLAAATSTKFKGFLLGVIITAVIQSSATTTVMVVGFVNSGILTLGQAIGIIMGANLGTSVTSWIMSLIGVDSDVIWVQFLNPRTFTPIIAFVAIILLLVFKKDSKKTDTATILFGLAFLMYGMQIITDAVSGLSEVPEFTELMGMFSNPILGVLAGAVITAVIQSSAASVGILQAISLNGALKYSSAIPIIMGQNIGTCVTAMISSLGANKNAKRAAFIHLSFNTIGTLVWLTIYCIINAVLKPAISEEAVNPLGIAICHSAFNVLTIVTLAPFNKLLEKLACVVIREGSDKGEFALLDDRLLSTPSIAIARSRTVAIKMAHEAERSLELAFDTLFDYNEKSAQKVRDMEDSVDMYEDSLGTYLVKVSNQNTSEADSHEVSKLLHMIGDFERLSDHTVNIIESAEEIHDKELKFSDDAIREIKIMISAVREILDMSITAFENNDLKTAVSVEPLEQVVDWLKVQIKSSHVERLRKQECTIEMGFVLSDLLTNLERISDHCSNIAVCMIEIAHDSFDMHEYINHLKSEVTKEYKKCYDFYKNKYALDKVQTQSQ
ncbi:MAG: Na/Pi cotransporter family protein [Ruminiclostridium sp.]|nr:Na/Pi cotransporter family protein [Ruminiclostridium sp.]